MTGQIFSNTMGSVIVTATDLLYSNQLASSDYSELSSRHSYTQTSSQSICFCTLSAREFEQSFRRIVDHSEPGELKFCSCLFKTPIKFEHNFNKRDLASQSAGGSKAYDFDVSIGIEFLNISIAQSAAPISTASISSDICDPSFHAKNSFTDNIILCELSVDSLPLVINIKNNSNRSTYLNGYILCIREDDYFIVAKILRSNLVKEVVLSKRVVAAQFKQIIEKALLLFLAEIKELSVAYREMAIRLRTHLITKSSTAALLSKRFIACGNDIKSFSLGSGKDKTCFIALFGPRVFGHLPVLASIYRAKKQSDFALVSVLEIFNTN